MRVVKYFCYEQPFLKREFKALPIPRVRHGIQPSRTGIFDIRRNELKGTRKIQIARSAK